MISALNARVRAPARSCIRRLSSQVETLRPPDGKDERIHILLKNVPQTATRADLRRAVTRAKLQGVIDTAVVYKHFKPTGQAFLTLSHSDHLWPNIKLLQNTFIGGYSINCQPSEPPATEPLNTRTRGLKGRKEASDRGYITGDGPHGGLTKSQKNVVIYGLPGKLHVDFVKEMLNDYAVDGREQGAHSIFQVPIPPDEFSLTSRYLVQLDSVSEAYRLVRDVHRSYFQQERHGTRFLLHAHVVQ